MNSITHVRHLLLDLHKTVIDAERRQVERDRGQLRDGEFLEALVHDEALAWLKPMTALIVRIDEALEDDEQTRQPHAIAAELRTLIASGSGGSEFQRRYADVLQRSPDALVAHVRAMRAL